MKGILFKPDMIKAIREGRKTQTRQLAGLKEINEDPDKWRFGDFIEDGWYVYDSPDEDAEPIKFIKPRYQVGDVVYIKEAYSHYGNELNLGVWTALVEYKLDGGKGRIPFAHTVPPKEKWWNTGKPLDYDQTPLFMPAWAARTFIKITDIRVGRLQEITEENARAEGICIIDNTPEKIYSPPNYPDAHRDIFMGVWESINKGYPWESNPFIWVYTFSKEMKPLL